MSLLCIDAGSFVFMDLDNTEIRLINALKRGLAGGQESRLIATCNCTGFSLRVLKLMVAKGVIQFEKDERFTDGYIVSLSESGRMLEDLQEQRHRSGSCRGCS